MKQTGILRIVLPVLLLPAMMAGCTLMKVTSLGEQPPPHEQHWTEVDVYQDIGDVPEAYQEIAVLEIRSALTKKKMLYDCRRRAARLGANGIVLQQVGRHDELVPIFTGSVYIPVVSEQWDGRILAIRVNRAPAEDVVRLSRMGQDGMS